MPRQTLFTVRADPQNQMRVGVSLSEPTPIVTLTDPALAEPPARALRDGVPCRVVVLAHGQQFLRLPDGQELFATKVRVVEDGSELQVFLPVPGSAAPLLIDGKELPAKRIPAEPNVLPSIGPRLSRKPAPAPCWPSGDRMPNVKRVLAIVVVGAAVIAAAPGAALAASAGDVFSFGLNTSGELGALHERRQRQCQPFADSSLPCRSRPGQ